MIEVMARKLGEITKWQGTVGHVLLNDGTIFYCPQTLNAIRHIAMCYVSRIYDPDPIALSEDDEIVVDIGGYIGMFSVYAAQKTNAKVYLFEPLPHMTEFCKLNVEANNLVDRVGVSGRAIDAKSGKRVMRFWQNSPEMAYFGKTDGYYNLNGELEVETISLEELNLPKIDFLKLNCEGAEGYIFPSMSKDYLAKIGRIAMQMHEDLSPVPGEALKKLLQEAGFKLRDENPKIKVHWIYAWRE